MKTTWSRDLWLGPRQVTVTADDRGPQINIVAWATMVFMILAVGTRLAIKYDALRRLGWDDGLVTAAMIFAIGQVAAVSTQVSLGGLGQTIDRLSDNEIQSFQKGQYAADLLYITALYFSNMSSVVYVLHITPDAKHRLWGKVLQIALTIWILVAFLGIAFECGLPSPWAIVTARCINIRIFWDIIGFLDILTGLGLILWPMYIIWVLQMARRQRILIIIAFACRLVLFPLIILRLIFLTSALNSSNKTFDYRKPVLVTLAHVNTSILVACIPFLKPFMQRLDSGLLTSDLRVRAKTARSHLMNTSSGNNGSEKDSRARSKGVLYPLKAMVPKKSVIDSRGFSFDGLHEMGVRHKVDISHNPPAHDAESRTSVGSDTMIIKRTAEFNVEREDMGKAV